MRTWSFGSERKAFRWHRSGAEILWLVSLVNGMAEGGDAAGGGDERWRPREPVVLQRSGLPAHAHLIAMEEWYTLPDTHEFRYVEVVVDYPPHRNHGRVGKVKCMDKSGVIGLIQFEGCREPVVFWPIRMSVLKVAVQFGSDAAILPRSVLEGFDLGELVNANAELGREQRDRRRRQYRGFEDR